MQPQYQVRVEDDDRRDRTFVRRLVLTVDGQVTRHWRAEAQVDLGPSASGGDPLIVKNAFVQFTGLASKGVTLTAGNQKVPFSRSLLTSSSKRVMVERPFTGDRAFGSPGRSVSLRADGSHAGARWKWAAAFGEARHDADPGEIRLEGLAEAAGDAARGRIAVGRVEWHPLGEVKLQQSADRASPFRATAAAAVYGWWNGEGIPVAATTTAASTSAVEVSGALRGHGLFVDVEYEHVSSDLVRTRHTGLYTGDDARVDKASIELGYVVVPRLELATAADVIDGPAFEGAWRRVAAGAVWYVRGHDLKVSLMHRESFGDEGQPGRRSRATYLQTQFAF